MKARKRFFSELRNGKPRCFRFGRRLRKNERKFLMWPPLVGGEQVCADCKATEGAEK